MKPVICIIGAKGHMGSAFTKLFRKHAMEVFEIDIDSELRAEDALPKANIVIFSVPIHSTVELIKTLAPLAKPGALVTDLTSIKMPAMMAIMNHAPSNCEILGLHPMFGPNGVDDLSRQVIALCPGRSGPWSKFLLNFFREQGAILKETTPEEHDRMMSIIQGITHLSSIATGMALKSLGCDVQRSLEFASPIYRLRLEMAGRILSQDAGLYADIAIANPQTEGAFRAYQNAINLLSTHIHNHDVPGFIHEFSEAADYLGGFKDEAYDRTNELIKRCKDIL